MTGPEHATLDRLEVRLFGEDGQGGALGVISQDIKTIVDRVGALEARNHAADAVTDAVSRLKKDESTWSRWRLGIAASLVGSIGGAAVYAVVDIAARAHP